MIPEITIKDYSYELPEERIAKFPLDKRDASKLLLFKDGMISDRKFTELPDLLPENALMVFNETKVVPARLHFQRSSGAHIEIFCLEPVSPSEYVEMFDTKGSCRWRCIVGNAKKWKQNEFLLLMNPENHPEASALNLRARLVEREGEGRTSIVEFVWDENMEFSRLLEICGSIPIPPYLNRETESIDLERYQTTYALQRGSVAAPTAGLHFTGEVLDNIARHNVEIAKVCLHVGAGTFLPVKSMQISGHTMHREPFVVTLDFLNRLYEALSEKRPVIAVGTTSVRTLESLYWAGVQLLSGSELHDVQQWEPYADASAPDGSGVQQWEPYADASAPAGISEQKDAGAAGRQMQEKQEPRPESTVKALIAYMHDHNMTSLSLGTRIIIVPGYKLRIVDALVTNFHQPQSTLLLLISAFVGEKWREIYSHALSHEYRFLSYGDSSLLFPVK